MSSGLHADTSPATTVTARGLTLSAAKPKSRVHANVHLRPSGAPFSMQPRKIVIVLKVGTGPCNSKQLWSGFRFRLGLRSRDVAPALAGPGSVQAGRPCPVQFPVDGGPPAARYPAFQPHRHNHRRMFSPAELPLSDQLAKRSGGCACQNLTEQRSQARPSCENGRPLPVVSPSEPQSTDHPEGHQPENEQGCNPWSIDQQRAQLLPRLESKRDRR